MKTLLALLGVLITGEIADVHAEEAKKPPAPRPGIANCEVFRPSGDYALVHLALTIPGDPKNTDRSNRVNQTWTYVGGVRGGKMRVTGHASKAINDRYTHAELKTLRHAVESVPSLPRGSNE